MTVSKIKTTSGALEPVSIAGIAVAQVQAPPVGSGSVTTPGVTPPTGETPGAGAPDATVGGRVAVEADARARLDSEGYRNVRDLEQGSDGLWRGTAMRGAARVSITVDAQGEVTTN